MTEPIENNKEKTSLPATEFHSEPAFLPSAEALLPEQASSRQLTKDNKQEAFSIRLLEKRISAGFSILAKVSIIILILLAMIFVGRQLADTGYTIKQVNMPVAFEEAGYTGPVVADKITSTLTRIVDKVKVSQSIIEFVNLSAEADVSVDLVGVGVPIRSVINLLGEAIGVNHSKTITTSITTDADTLIVTTHISGEVPEQFKFEMHGGKEAALKKAVEQASYTILKYTAPDILGLHLVDAKDSDRGIALAKFMLERHKGNAYYEERACADWIAHLCYQNKLDKANEMVEKALEKFPESASLYNKKGLILSIKGDMDGTLAVDKKVMNLVALEDNHNSRMSRSCSTVGYDFTLMNQSDSAVYYLQKGINLDPSESANYYNMGINYLLLKRDTVHFLEYFEQSLERGYKQKILKTDPDVQGVLNDERVKKLLVKYSEE